MKTLPRLIKFYQCSNKQEFFMEMQNCLELSDTIITEDNYKDYLAEFEAQHRMWVESFLDY